MSIEFSASQLQARETLLPTSTTLRPHLYGLGYPRQASPSDNFIERLYLKTVSLEAKSKLTLHDYSCPLLNNEMCKFPFFFEFPLVI